MTLYEQGRAFVLALLCVFGGAHVATAHSLPGSSMYLSQADGELTLSIRFSLDDLVVASSLFDPLMQLSPGDEIGMEQQQRLAAYLDEHLTLEHVSGRLPLQLTAATLQQDQHHDVGSFVVVDATLISPLPPMVIEQQDVLPLTLSYDAVMHEVRNHRATVYLGQQDAQPVRVAHFGYRPVDGKQQTIRIERP